MEEFRIRRDLKRAVIDGFALPLGIQPAPAGSEARVGLRPPSQGYTLTYTSGEEDEPDTYAFHIVVSHERLRPLLRRAFEFLPDEVFAIVEVGSRDAYRQIDVFLGGEPLNIEEFCETWERYEPVLLEDATIAAGANSEEPFVEIFLDQWKGLSIHVPLGMRDEIEAMLQSFGLEEVPQTWPPETDEQREQVGSYVCPVLDNSDLYLPDLDELLLNLRHEWRLELNVDPESNLDESGRRLGPTLWHALVIVENENDSEDGAYMSIWATAGSLAQMEQIIDTAIDSQPGWRFSEIYTIDRVAFDERPEQLSQLPPRRVQPEIHLIEIDRWNDEPKTPPGEPLRPGEEEPRFD